MSLSALFIDVSTLPEDGYGLFQLVFLGACYAYVLCYASNMISDGSELLLLIPSIAGLVGSVVLPVLGAVPDGAIVLFSGLGPDAQNQLNVGIGALAGSTIMLLTAPWLLSVLGGRVSVKDGVAIYKGTPKPHPNSEFWNETGVSLAPSVKYGGYLMMITSIPYIIIQLPAIMYAGDGVKEIGVLERPYAFIGMITCTIFFVGYLYYMKEVADKDLRDKRRFERVVQKIQDGQISLRSVIIGELEAEAAKQNISQGEKMGLLKDKALQANMEIILKPFFRKYTKDGNNFLTSQDLSVVFKELGEHQNKKMLTKVFKVFDKDHNNQIEFNEFVDGISNYVITTYNDPSFLKSSMSNKRVSTVEDGDLEMLIVEGKEDEEDDEEEIPEEFADLDHEAQQAAVSFKAAWMLTLGTVLVVLFSDPMVDVLNELGTRTNIPPFYVSFVLAPLASNASEVIASYNYAQKKTAGSMAISLSALQGACCMNNTFVLGIFMICVYSQSLAWQFFAETVSILFSVLFIAIMSLKPTHTMLDAAIICSMYPLALVLVYCLEAAGFD